MTSVTKLMQEYFDVEGYQRKSSVILQSLHEQTSLLPVVPSKCEWRTVSDPERFMRRFEFNSRQSAMAFVTDLLSMEDELGHHGKITIEHKQVDIEVYTHTVDCITELDQEYVHLVDQVYEDVLHYGYE